MGTVCPFPGCGKDLKRAARAQEHYLVEHMGVRYNCPGCGVGFKSRTYAQNHHQGHCRPK